MCKGRNRSTFKIIQAVCFLSFLLFLITIFQKADAQSKPWPVPAQATSVKNPVPGDPAKIKEAKALYTSYCVPCHGDKGKGDGIAAAGLNPRPADHTSAAIQDESDGTLFYKLSEGRSPMPSYKTVLTETQRWELIDYIRTLNKTAKK